MKTSFWATAILWITAVTALNAYGIEGEGIVLEPNTGDYLITYYGTGNPGDKKHKILRQATFVPATKINPAVVSIFKLRENEEVSYAYRITNGRTSKQPLAMMILDPVVDIDSVLPLPKREQDVDLNTISQTDASGVAGLTTPENWTGRTTTSHIGGLRIGWSYDSSDTFSGLAPGKTQSGFGFSSKVIPGVVTAQLIGDSPVLGFVDEGPTGKISDLLEKLTRNDFVSRNVAAPTISVPDPFDAAVLLERIQTQTHTWIDKQLLDVTFSAQLDRYFQSAISAYRLNQPKVGKKQIQTMRELLKKEHEDMGRDEEHESDNSQGKDDGKKVLIDRLAAQVLDFDLQYVSKRMSGDKDD